MKCNEDVLCQEESVHNFTYVGDFVLESSRVLPYDIFHRAFVVFMLYLPIDAYKIRFIHTAFFVGLLHCTNASEFRPGCCSYTKKFKIILDKTLTPEGAHDFSSWFSNITYWYKERMVNQYGVAKGGIGTPTICKGTAVKGNKFHNDDYRSLFENVYTNMVRNESLNSLHEVPQSINVTVNVSSSIINIIHSSLILRERKNYSASGAEDTSRTLALISYTTMGVSTVALIVTSVFLIYLSHLKSLADQMIINIMANLILVNTLFIFGIGATAYETICFGIGVVLHYLWLCVFSWVCIYTAVIARILYELKRNIAFNAEEHHNKRWLYGLSYGLPALIVLPCLLIEYLQIENFKMQYNHRACFPTGYPTNIIFFTGPIILSLFVNFCLLVLSLKLLAFYCQQRIRGSSLSNLSYCMSFIRLCVISGIFWLLGVLAEALDDAILAFSFVILAGCQGLTVCLCILTSYRLRTLGRKRQIPQKSTSKSFLETRT